jgi:hypothetical protein
VPELSATDLAQTCLNLLLKGAMGREVHDLQVLAGRVATAIPLVAEQVLAERRTAQIADAEVAADVTTVDRAEVTEVEQAVVETIDTFREELAARSHELGKLSPDDLAQAVAGLVEVHSREQLAEPGDGLARAQCVDEQWQSLQGRLQEDVARQRDALALLALDRARPGAADLTSPAPDLAAELRDVDGRLEELRAEQRNEWNPDRHESIVELDHRGSQLAVDVQVAMVSLETDVARQLDECRGALEAARQLVPDGSTAALRYEVALERLAPGYQPPEPGEAPGRVSPWGRELERSVCNDAYLKTVDVHASLRQETVWKVLEVVADLKQSGLVAPEDPVGIARASFHLGSGSLAERTDAAHKLPGQLTIGLDQARLTDPGLAERFRLDNLVPAAEDVLRQSVRGWFGTTTVTDLYVNAVDSLWEKKGLGEAFRSAVQDLVRQPPDGDRQAALDQAYARFQEAALAALERARAHNEDELRDLRRRPPTEDPHPRTLTIEDRENMRVVLDEYQRCLEEKRLEDLRQAVAWR